MFNFADCQEILFGHERRLTERLVQSMRQTIEEGGRVLIAGTAATDALCKYLNDEILAASSGLPIHHLQRIGEGEDRDREIPVAGDLVIGLGGTKPDLLFYRAVETWRHRGIETFVLVSGAPRSDEEASNEFRFPTADPGLFGHAAILLFSYLRRRILGGRPEDRCRFLIRFFCRQCEKIVLADAARAGQRGVCPHCEAEILLPEGPARPYLVGKPAFGEKERRVDSRFAIEDCKVAVSIERERHLIRPLSDLSTGGLAFSAPEGCVWLREGREIRIRLDVPAFLEPLDLDGVVTHREDSGRVGVRFEDCSDKTRAKLARLEEIFAVGVE